MASSHVNCAFSVVSTDCSILDTAAMNPICNSHVGRKSLVSIRMLVVQMAKSKPRCCQTSVIKQLNCFNSGGQRFNLKEVTKSTGTLSFPCRVLCVFSMAVAIFFSDSINCARIAEVGFNCSTAAVFSRKFSQVM